MVSTPKKTTTGKKTKPAGKKKSTVATASLETLQKTKAAGRAQYGRPKRTRGNYDGYLARGKMFLKDLVAQRREVEETQGPIDDGIDTEELAHAFDDKHPNKMSTVALELFLTQKCLTDNRGISTAEGIRGAFADYWDSMDGDKYNGEYKYNKATDTVQGCPARASVISSFIKMVRAKDGAKGAAATRHHAEAMRIEDLAKIMTWSESQVPYQMAHRHSHQANSPGTPENRSFLLKHVMMRAFLTSGFTLWTRNFELCGLQRRDLELGCIGSSPLYLPFFKVKLENRKGWQNKQGWNGPLESNTYHIYKQSKWEMDMYTHLQLWMAILEQELGRPLAPDDYLFPYISPNGLIDPKQCMSHDVVQNLLSEFSQGAGVNKYYTTHCLRRGGAQYRLMYAPLGQRWSLSIVRWWGGWAMGEQVDTLMKYLIDSLQSYENGYNDALCPARPDVSKTFMGEGDVLRPVTINDLHVLVEALMSNLRVGIPGLPPSMNHPVTMPQNHLPPIRPTPPTFSSRPVASASITSGNTLPVLCAVNKENGGSVSSHPIAQLTLGKKRTKPRGIRQPIPGVVIPNLGRKKGSWRVAIKQWEQGDPSIGLIPLKDWPREWYTGVMRTKTGVKRHQREMIVKEYERLGRNDAAFEALYSNTRGQSALIQAIRKNRSDYKKRSRNTATSQSNSDISMESEDEGSTSISTADMESDSNSSY